MTSDVKKKATSKKTTTKKTTPKKAVTAKHVAKNTKVEKVTKNDLKNAKHVKKSNKPIRIIVIILFVVCLCGLCYSGYNIYEWFTNLNENKSIKDNTNKYITEDDGKLSIDFDALKKANKDTVGFLEYQPFGIEYVVVKGKNNTYYLNHNFNKKYNKAGWIYADYRNKLDNTDKNIVIYGHSMRDGSMFGRLNLILEDRNYEKEENKTFSYITQEATYNYKVFSVFTIKAEDYYITTDFNNKKEWTDFIKKMKKRSVYNYNIEVGEDDSIITLSTCQGLNGKRRLVIQGVRVKEEVKKEKVKQTKKD